MPKYRRLTESEESIAQRCLQGLKSELSRVVPGESNNNPTSNDYLQWMEWVQYEGIKLDRAKVTSNTVFPVLLLIAEHLQTNFGFILLQSDDLLVLQHDRFKGCVPLEMLAFRPTQPRDGRWLDEDDPIDRAIQAVWKIERALKQRESELLCWPNLLLGKNWHWAMTHPFLQGMIQE